MKTKEDTIKEGYPEDWSCKCDLCGSWNCHKYDKYSDCTCSDPFCEHRRAVIVCFDCGRKFFERPKNFAKFVGKTMVNKKEGEKNG